MSASHPRSPAETSVVLGVALVLAAWALLVAPVGEIPRGYSSWDPLHSGRRFAEQGFLASKLQPIWSPANHPAQYLTYTHYPPLPYWLAGAVESLIQGPSARIEALLRIALLVGLGALLCGYRFLRSLALSPAAALLACGALVGSADWWNNASGELSWVSWLSLFQLGGAAALGSAFAHWETRGRIGVLLALLCTAAGALSAFEAWPWLPTILAVLALAAARGRRDRLRALVLATLLAGGASLGGAATRVAINWWHFGSLERVVQDLEETYSARSIYAYASLEIAENRANYMALPRQPAASHWAWVREFFRTLPSRLGDFYLPEAEAVRWAFGAASVLALPGWLFARRRQLECVAPWPGRPVWLIALALAGLPFALLCPAIAVQQGGLLMAFAPALLLAVALVCEGLLAPLRAAIARLPGRLLAFVLAGAAAAWPIVRGPAPALAWPAPLAQCVAAMHALSQIDGVVFVDLDNVNPLVFLTPLGASVAFKPVEAQARYFKGVRPLRILRIAGQGRLSERELAKLERVDVAGLPEGFELLVPRSR